MHAQRHEHLLMLKITGECWTKSDRTRRRFLRSLRRNVRAALARAGVEGTVQDDWSRLFLETDEPLRARDALRGVFGLHSISEVALYRFGGLDELVARAVPLFRERVANRTFAVRAKRTGTHPFRSHDIARALGTALLPHARGVDLETPEVTVSIEVMKDRAYAFLEAEPGAGGLPVGTGGRAICLFSGGFDSPVAAWMAASRGTAQQLVVFDLVRGAQTDAVLEVARTLAARWLPGVEPHAHVVDLSPFVAELTARTEPRLRQVLLKRGMYRVGKKAAREFKADALVTGESIGQASSQTVQNLAVTERVTDLLVIRPLIGMAKEEIVGRAREIGTAELSARIREYCGIAGVPVETAARRDDVEAAERPLDPGILQLAWESRRTVDLAFWTPAPPPAHIVFGVPPGAVVIDVRDAHEPGRRHGLPLPFSRAAEWMDGLDPKRTYLFVCPAGLRSERIARDLRESGVDAYCLAGGAAHLKVRKTRAGASRTGDAGRSARITEPGGSSLSAAPGSAPGTPSPPAPAPGTTGSSAR